MKQGIFRIRDNREIAKKIYLMELEGDCSALTKPGQFINIKLDGLYLRRPISVASSDGDKLTIIYKKVGAGTGKMSEMKTGETLDVLTGLGNGFDVSRAGNRPLLIGGGVGIPPMYELAKELIKTVKPEDISVILGFNGSDEVFFSDEFRALGVNTYVCTVDGSVGEKGFVTDVMKTLSYTYLYTCGPMAMFEAIEKIAASGGEYSFEERMGCGFGVCMGCSCKTKYGNKRICKDGPVLKREEIIW